MQNLVKIVMVSAVLAQPLACMQEDPIFTEGGAPSCPVKLERVNPKRVKKELEAYTKAQSAKVRNKILGYGLLGIGLVGLGGWALAKLFGSRQQPPPAPAPQPAQRPVQQRRAEPRVGEEAFLTMFKRYLKHGAALSLVGTAIEGTRRIAGDLFQAVKGHFWGGRGETPDPLTPSARRLSMTLNLLLALMQDLHVHAKNPILTKQYTLEFVNLFGVFVRSLEKHGAVFLWKARKEGGEKEFNHYASVFDRAFFFCNHVAQCIEYDFAMQEREEEWRGFSSGTVELVQGFKTIIVSFTAGYTITMDG